MGIFQSKQNFDQPFVICVEGLIGSGKSTLINDVITPILTSKGWRVTVIREPVDKWTEILPRFYSDPKRWAYHFQTKAFHDRVRESIKRWSKYKDTTDIFICERSVFSDTIFMKTLREQGNIDDMEWDHYVEWWIMWENVMPFTPDMFVYLSPSINEVMKRVKIRNRDGEEGVSQEYQELLQQKHDDHFNDNYAELPEGRYIPVHKIETDLDFKTDTEIQRRIVDELEEKIIQYHRNR